MPSRPQELVVEHYSDQPQARPQPNRISLKEEAFLEQALKGLSQVHLLARTHNKSLRTKPMHQLRVKMTNRNQDLITHSHLSPGNKPCQHLAYLELHKSTSSNHLKRIRSRQLPPLVQVWPQTNQNLPLPQLNKEKAQFQVNNPLNQLEAIYLVKQLLKRRKMIKHIRCPF